jgi:transketolase
VKLEMEMEMAGFAMPFGRALAELGARREDVVVLVADLGRYVETGDFAERFPERYLQMGMSEQNLIGVAAGMAKAGLHPVVVTYGVFITRRAYDQVAMALCTGPTPATLVGFMPGITTPFRATHQAVDDIALMRALPEMTVVDPGDAFDLQGALMAASTHSGPVYIRAFRGQQRPLPRSPEAAEDGFQLGATTVLQDRGEVGFVSSGLGSQWATEAVAELAMRGITTAHLHVPTVKPLDRAAVLGFCTARTAVVCVENHSEVGGLHAAVAGAAAAEGLGVPVRCAGVPDVWPPAGSVAYIRRQLGLDVNGLVARALAAIEGRP